MNRNKILLHSKFLLLVRQFQKGVYCINNFIHINSFSQNLCFTSIKYLQKPFILLTLLQLRSTCFSLSPFDFFIAFLFSLQTLTDSAFSFSFFLLLHFQRRLFFVLGALSAPVWTLISCCRCFADTSGTVCRRGESAMLGPWLWVDPPPATSNLPCKHWRGGETHGGADILIHIQ